MMKPSTLAFLPSVLILSLASCKKASEQAAGDSSQKNQPSQTAASSPKASAKASAASGLKTVSTAASSGAEKISFSTQVLPILSNNWNLPTPQLAALSFTMSTVFNLDETITRD